MDDIVERLRKAAHSGDLALGQSFDCMAVADEIERLRQRGDNLHALVMEMPNPMHNLSWLTWRTQIDNALMGWEEARRG